MSKYGYRCEGRKVREDTESWRSVQAYMGVCVLCTVKKKLKCSSECRSKSVLVGDVKARPFNMTSPLLVSRVLVVRSASTTFAS